MKNIKLLGKLSALVLTIVLLGGYLVGCNSNKGGDISSLEKIKSKGVLVVGTAPGYPPFEFIKSSNGKGEVVGADIDLAKKIASELDVKLEIKAMEFDSILGALQGNKIDIALTAMTPTEERKKSLDFSDIYYEGNNLVLVGSDSERSE